MMVICGEMERSEEEEVMASFKVLPWYLPRVMEENNENPQSK
jgi:hypothetical protein